MDLLRLPQDLRRDALSHYEQDVSGYWYLVPSSLRYGAQALRDEADILDEKNAQWDAVVKASQSDGRAES